MDSDDESAPQLDNKYQKDAKVGEGTYAVVYRGKVIPKLDNTYTHISPFIFIKKKKKGTEKSSGRKVAIKKIKMGQFKDGLDLTAIREVKYLQELRHPNVIEVKQTTACCFLNTVFTFSSF
jgi:cyclin-dependent kinase 7